MNTTQKHTRLYITKSLTSTAALDKDQTHYLRNVMRMSEGDQVRLFNGKDGEWLAEITKIGKKETALKLNEQLRHQPEKQPEIHLLFAPIKKQRLDFLIEKAVELGATHLHPVLTDHTEKRHIKPERIQAQIIEATEQCERLDITALTALTSLKEKIIHWNDTPEILWAAERMENTDLLTNCPAANTFLIGPEGGFSQEEYTFLSENKRVKPVSLGSNILRAETAAIYCLSNVKN